MPSPTKPRDPGPLIDMRDAATELRVSVVTIRRMRRDGQLPTVKVRGAVRIPLRAVQAYRAAQNNGGAA